MATVVRDTRKFPSQRIPYLNRTIDDLFADLLELKRANCPDWTDESPSDFGMQLLWLFAVMGGFLGSHLERAKDNCFLATAWDREAVRRLCEGIDYTLSEGAAASVDVTFALQSGHPEFTIPAGTKISTRETRSIPAIVFETASARLVAVGETSVTLSCLEGQSVANEVIGSSDGSARQRMRLSRKPVVWQSESVQVFENDAWQTWTRVANFIDSGGADNDYRLAVDADGFQWIEFGDGVNGRIPPRGTNGVRVSYRRGGGSAGNIAAASIVDLISTVNYVESVTNAQAASGGADRETLDHARVFAPWSIKTLDRGVSPNDLEYLCESYRSVRHGSIAQAKAIENGGFGVNLMVVPASGGNPSAALKAELLAYLTHADRKPLCISISVIDPAYVYVDVTAAITVLQNYTSSAVLADVRSRVAAYLSPVYQDPGSGLFAHDFGRDLYLSDLYAIIDGTPGVDHVTLTAPAADVLIADNQIANVGTITLTATDPTGGQAYFQAANDAQEAAK